MNIDETKTIIGNKKYLLAGKEFSVPDSYLNQNKQFAKQSSSEVAQENTKERNSKLIQSENTNNKNNCNININLGCHNSDRNNDKVDFIKILSENEVPVKPKKQKNNLSKLNIHNRNFQLTNAGYERENCSSKSRSSSKKSEINSQRDSSQFSNRKRKSDNSFDSQQDRPNFKKIKNDNHEKFIQASYCPSYNTSNLSQPLNYEMTNLLKCSQLGQVNIHHIKNNERNYSAGLIDESMELSPLDYPRTVTNFNNRLNEYYEEGEINHLDEFCVENPYHNDYLNQNKENQFSNDPEKCNDNQILVSPDIKILPNINQINHISEFKKQSHKGKSHLMSSETIRAIENNYYRSLHEETTKKEIQSDILFPEEEKRIPFVKEPRFCEASQLENLNYNNLFRENLKNKNEKGIFSNKNQVYIKQEAHHSLLNSLKNNQFKNSQNFKNNFSSHYLNLNSQQVQNSHVIPNEAKNPPNTSRNNSISQNESNFTSLGNNQPVINNVPKSKIYELETNPQNNKKIDLKTAETAAQLKQLISTKKVNNLFKIFYLNKQLNIDLFIDHKTISNSSMTVEHFLFNSEILGINLKSDYEVVFNLSIRKGNDPESLNFLDDLANNKKIAIAHENLDCYAIIHSNNKDLFSYLKIDCPSNESQEKLVIIKILSEASRDLIRQISLDRFENKERVSLSNSLSEIDTSTIKQEAPLISNEELNKLQAELQELRKFKHNHKQIDLAKKEEENKKKYEIYYNNLIAKEINNYKNLENEMKHVKKFNELTLNEKESLVKQYKQLEVDYQKISSQLEENKSQLNKLDLTNKKVLQANKDLKKNLGEKNDLINSLQLKKSELEKENEELKQNLINVSQNLEEMKKKMYNSQSNIENYIIQEFKDDEEGVTSLKHQDLERIADEFLCMICHNNIRNCLFESCGHLVTCFDCQASTFLTKNFTKQRKIVNRMETKGNFNCYICQEPNTSFRKIFLS